MSGQNRLTQGLAFTDKRVDVTRRLNKARALVQAGVFESDSARVSAQNSLRQLLEERDALVAELEATKSEQLEECI